MTLSFTTSIPPPLERIKEHLDKPMEKNWTTSMQNSALLKAAAASGFSQHRATCIYKGQRNPYKGVRYLY